jgi:hypothetical protein
MTLNMGSADRGLRLALAVVLLLLVVFFVDGVWAWVLGIAAVILGATALVGTCPLYLPFGISTRRR